MSYIVQGKEFKTYAEISEYYNIPIPTLQYRMRSCKDIEKAVLKTLNKKGYTVKGITFESVDKACDFFGLDKKKVYAHAGYKKCSTEESMNSILSKYNSIDLSYFKSIDEICNNFNISKKAIEKHISKGKSVELAVEIELRNKEKGFKFKGKLYENLDQICEDYLLNKIDIAMELSKGITLMEALDKVIKNK